MKNVLMSLALGVALAVPSVSVGQETPNTGAMSFSGGVDWVSSYYFRGFLQEPHGIIVQPYATVGFQIVDFGEVSTSGYVGTWNSFHSKQTGSAGINDIWYESDLFGGVDFHFGALSVGAVYTAYTSPNHAFDSLQEVGLLVRFDDRDLMEQVGIPLGFNPYMGLYFETRGGNAAYLELGAVPTFDIQVVGTDMPLEISIPIVLGLSVDDYYFDAAGDEKFFGYFSLGGMASIPLPMPREYGEWALTGGISWLYLGDNNARAVNRGQRANAVIGSLGVGFTY